MKQSQLVAEWRDEARREGREQHAEHGLADDERLSAHALREHGAISDRTHGLHAEEESVGERVTPRVRHPARQHVAKGKEGIRCEKGRDDAGQGP